MPIKDSLIAATALTHDLIVATRNSLDSRRPVWGSLIRLSTIVVATLLD
jgi:predicted nucleic acid-binding protein